MEDPFDRVDLTTSYLSIEFGTGGRMLRLWAGDPDLPEEGEEFQFSLNPLTFGEEASDRYLPGSILLGARLRPDEPWVLDRNQSATPHEELDNAQVKFEYEFGLLPELRVTGRFYEVRGPRSYLVWDVRVANRGRVSVEIGELAFPFALINVFEGARGMDSSGKGMANDRVRIHRHAGGAGSYLFATRLSGESPSLCIFPGEDTTWDLISSVPGSLSTPLRWPGIPVVYLLSRAAVEREGWSEWQSNPQSLILEPGDSRTFQTCFATSSADPGDGLQQLLSQCGQPSMRVLPSAVVPASVGVAIEVTGPEVAEFYASAPASVESDTDENGGFCFVKPRSPGPCRVLERDVKGRLAHADVLFLEPIDSLIKKRAQWIASRQVHHGPDTVLHKAIVPTHIKTGQQVTGHDEFTRPFTVESCLSDALFLAEKNTLYPDAREIEIVEAFVEEFVLDDLQNPGTFAVGSAFPDLFSASTNFRNAHSYVLLTLLYDALSRCAGTGAPLQRTPEVYLELAIRTLQALFQYDLIPSRGLRWLDALVSRLEGLGQGDLAFNLKQELDHTAHQILRNALADLVEFGWEPTVPDRIGWAASRLADTYVEELCLYVSATARSLAPDWKTYCADQRLPIETRFASGPTQLDRAELSLGYSTVANSLRLLDGVLGGAYEAADSLLRMAFGGIIAPWGLVREDGSASMGVCNDPASRQRGFAPYSGDIGFTLYEYLRGAATYVLPHPGYGVFSFGGQFAVDEVGYAIRPWDGLGRRIHMGQLGCDLNCDYGRILEANVDARKRHATVRVENPSPFPTTCTLTVAGLWGSLFDVGGKEIGLTEGALRHRLDLPPSGIVEVEIRVKP